MLLNHLPISFSTPRFAGFQVPYVGKDELKVLRTSLFKTHFVLRSGDQVLLFPYVADTATDGQAIELDTVKDFGMILPPHNRTRPMRWLMRYPAGWRAVDVA
jgi:hypothetical protein